MAKEYQMRAFNGQAYFFLEVEKSRETISYLCRENDVNRGLHNVGGYGVSTEGSSNSCVGGV